ncbi:tRNA glutamyl-Q(34) synthetase GluQRS [Vitreoscilla massiliensis]|uniref:Glutamyl-Q tRNA(Asp) synthetase n=1 Tax=Vitreoscilla massiliensis TaxID=1689272 RepID=A0ABY4E5Z9_9NEIS|nr:tRNA glutamyl-Q(34) synthetase GluQRS [Vitreoscilla massiliensis]UOO90718.1 tRNA glutamyl-Q(34) synthetase GluQRS [Vitreoscilla massiliensis]
MIISDSKPYIGRFAPSPTGRLHIGSLLTAVATYLDARQHGGTWLVRMEDLDPPREMAGAADDILRTLEAFALYWDGAVMYQHERNDAYQAALEALQAADVLYPCYCSRKDIAALNPVHGVDGWVYPRICADKAYRPPHTDKTPAWRVRVPDAVYGFDDAIVGHYQQNLAHDVGDFVLKRADGWWAYQLAVVVDDAAQGMSHVVRGQDLLVSTPRQLYLQQLLGLPQPHYAHLPLLTNALGQKWSKQTRAPALDVRHKECLLNQVLDILGLPKRPVNDMTCAELLAWAVNEWDIEKVPSQAHITEAHGDTDTNPQQTPA